VALVSSVEVEETGALRHVPSLQGKEGPPKEPLQPYLALPCPAVPSPAWPCLAQT
jgi:hypothetical protein